MICLEHNAIAAREHERQQLAALMARYEQQHGAIQTQPTRIGTGTGGLNGKRWVDTVGPLSRPRASSEPKPKATRLPRPRKPKPAAERSERSERRRDMTAAHNVRDQRTAKRLEQLRPLAARGLTIREMAEALGCARRTIIRDIEQHNIPRGPKLQLEA